MRLVKLLVTKLREHTDESEVMIEMDFSAMRTFFYYWKQTTVRAPVLNILFCRFIFVLSFLYGKLLPVSSTVFGKHEK